MKYLTDEGLAFSAAGKCLDYAIPFILYRHPGERSFYFWAHDVSRNDSRDTVYKAVIHPWSGKEETISAHYTAEEIINKGFSSVNSCLKEIENLQTSKEVYTTGINEIIQRLRSRGGKTVISRVITRPLLKKDITSVAKSFFEIISNAYALLYLTPDGICWLTASPECLYDACSHNVRTMALAGTRSLNNAEEPWDKKNIDEHLMVADYIEDKLQSIQGCEYHRYPLTNLNYGRIQHLHTPFKAVCKKPHIIGKVLHPTPAVCGFPIENALTDIAEVERHNRLHYAGYVELKLAERQIGVVNLRCAQLSETRACLYSGGGITALSSPEKEWEETASKASVLIKVIKQVSEP